MASYFVDTEFNGFGGDIISFALVRDDGAYLSLVFGCEKPVAWVKEHVMPHLYAGKVSHESPTIAVADAPKMIGTFLFGDPDPIVYADWPDDIRYFCSLLMPRPGFMIGVKNLTFKMIRCDAYPTTVEGAIQHNAYWDALALRDYLMVK